MSIKLRKIELTDKEELMDMLKEYEKNDPVPGIYRYEGIRNFEKLKDLDFELWLEEQISNETDENLPDRRSQGYLLFCWICCVFCWSSGIRTSFFQACPRNCPR